MTLDEANSFVSKHHRHHQKVVGHKFSIGISDGEKVVGVCIVGRPVARGNDKGWTLEVTRLCTDGTRNACSMLYSAAQRAAFAMGYKRIITYILKSENGASLYASNYRLVGEIKGKSWNTPSRPRVDKHPITDKLLFEVMKPTQPEKERTHPDLLKKGATS